MSKITVNGTDGVPSHEKNIAEALEKLQIIPQKSKLQDILVTQGVSGLQEWISNQSQLFDRYHCETHQSLFATRMRTHDMLPIAGKIDQGLPQLFSAEAWAATFDVAYRFLHEDPWAG